VGGNYCTGSNGSCVPKKAPGNNSCMSGHECTTGNCVDGVCCNAPGCGVCQVCNGADPGNCTPAPDGKLEPHSRCTPNPPCGNTGFCSGGACTQVGAGLMCTSFNCLNATTFQPAGACNGTGSCVVPGAVDCSPYLCTTGSCLTTCSGDNQCVNANPNLPSAHYCNGTNCVPKKSIGLACLRDGECGSGHCTDGFCCGVTSCPSCQSCGVSMNEGMCANLPAHAPDPTGVCTTQSPSTCGTNGRCNGGGNCELYDTSTVCSTTCISPTFTTFSCDGLGACVLPEAQLCGINGCDANGCIP
jgi:hypothetical protein